MEKTAIEKASPADHEILTKITKDGKAFWGYSKEQIDHWEQDLTITAQYIEQNETYKLVLNDRIIGYYSYLNLGKGHLKLDYFFLFQKYIGKGYGQLLLRDFLEKAKSSKTVDIILEAEPNAENFYAKFGFKTYDQKESSIKGRFLPLMKLVFR